jgi:hypothetical protein
VANASNLLTAPCLRHTVLLSALVTAFLYAPGGAQQSQMRSQSGTAGNSDVRKHRCERSFEGATREHLVKEVAPAPSLDYSILPSVEQQQQQMCDPESMSLPVKAGSAVAKKEHSS